LIDRRWQSSIQDVRYFRGADCDTDHHLVAASSKIFDVKRFNRKKLSDLQVRKQYQIEILNRSATLENLNARVDKNGAWEKSKGYFKTSGNDSLPL
jgi:hypothetical protein